MQGQSEPVPARMSRWAGFAGVSLSLEHEAQLLSHAPDEPMLQAGVAARLIESRGNFERALSDRINRARSPHCQGHVWIDIRIQLGALSCEGPQKGREADHRRIVRA